MIVYLDTSGLVKLFLIEPGSEAVHNEAQQYRRATSTIAYAEACAALAMAVRMGRIADAGLAAATEQLNALWPSLLRVQVTESLVRQAAALALRLPLKGYDAVHLASALEVSSLDEVTLATWDRQLATAAQSQGLRTFPAEPEE